MPEPTEEKKSEMKFHALQKQVDELRRDLDKLQSKMTAFEWKMEKLFYEAREEALWEKMLNINILKQCRTPHVEGRAAFQEGCSMRWMRRVKRGSPRRLSKRGSDFRRIMPGCRSR